MAKSNAFSPHAKPLDTFFAAIVFFLQLSWHFVLFISSSEGNAFFETPDLDFLTIIISFQILSILFALEFEEFWSLIPEAMQSFSVFLFHEASDSK